ncbi:MAG: restriction endonuclease [Chlorobiaceae bacterium]|nr:restriction endonuclease [Chlorobiaceae bacterium]NTV24849.1 restriction endonuclease [Chlorobiaceae bacterium]
MVLDLAGYEQKTRNAIRAFWGNQEAICANQPDAQENQPVTWRNYRPGKNMDGFLDLIIDIVEANGLKDAEIHRKSGMLTLPGFFRPTKFWDLLVIHKGQLIAAIELKSQIGPSFGNNFNSRIEQTVGNAYDFWAAYREGLFGSQPRPFIGWLIVVEDAPESHASIKDKSLHFPINDEFRNVSYLRRYDLFCQKLMREQLFTAAAVISSPKEAISSGEFSSVTPMTSLKAFITALATHMTNEAHRMSEIA